MKKGFNGKILTIKIWRIVISLTLYQPTKKNHHFMRLILTALSIIQAILLVSSCSKMSPDSADAFVGIYSASVIENVVWGYDSGTINDNGTLFITKLSANRVKVSGFLSTEGEVVGSYVYFEGESSYDSTGHLTISYSQGILSGNVLTFTVNMTGELASNGVLYPFRSTGYFTAIKQ